MIKKESIENLKNNLDIVDVISQFLEVKKSGANFKACCPFHGESTPSFVVSPAKQIYHCFGCLAPTEEIRTKDGIKEIQDIQIGDYVFASNGKETKVIESLSHKPQYGMLKFKTDLFDEWSYFTQNHDMVVLTQDDVKKNLPYIRVEKNRPLKFYGNIKRRKHKKEINIKTQVLFAKEVKKGDYFLYPIDREVITNKTFDFSDFWEKNKLGPSVDIIKKVKITKDLMWLFGMYIAEGSTYRGGIKFSLHSKEINYAEKIIETLKKSFKKEASLFYPKNRKNSLEVTCSSTNLEYIFKKLFASGAQNKEYPYYFNYLKKSFKSSLFEGLMDGDGCYSRRTYKTISKKLSYLLFDLAISLELIPSIYKEKKYKDKKNVNHKKSYTILFHKRESLKAFFENINDVKYLFMRVKSIKESEDEELVYDITVEDRSHTFLTKNFIVGNCGVGGDSIKFMMEYEKLSYPEAIEKLASMNNVTLEYDNVNTKKQDIRILEDVNKFYQRLYVNNNTTKEYIASRGISEFSVEKFEIGYAPSSGDTINFLKSNHYNLSDAIDLGVIDTGTNGLYSRFIERITFPIYGINGKMVGFGGRTITGHNAKYVNSPQTKVFNKSRLLYGYHLAKEHIYKKNQLIVCEGYLDVIMLHQAGFNTAVATLGTALTKDHLPLIRRGEPKIILAYDGDKAGLAAAFKASVMLSQSEFEGGVVIFGEGIDPADMVKDGKTEELNKIFASPMSFIPYAIDYIISKYEINNPAQKQKALIEANDYLKSLGVIYQDEYKRYIAQKLNIRENLVKVSADIQKRPEESNLSKIDIAELCIIKSILEKPSRLDSVLDIVDSSMFEAHKYEFELLLNDITNISLNSITLNEKLENYDDERLNKELLTLLYKFYTNKLTSTKFNDKLSLKEKSLNLRKIQDALRQLKSGKLVSYNL